MAAYRVAALSVCLMLAMTTAETQIRYPETRKTDQVDDYHGTKVADPYRWLEDDNSAETTAWVEAENKVTFGYLEQIPAARADQGAADEAVELRALRRAVARRASCYFFARNDGLQNQAVLYTTRDARRARPRCCSIRTRSRPTAPSRSAAPPFSDDGKLLAYALSASGSDWQRVAGARRRDRQGPADDVLKWSKFSRRRLAARTARASSTAATTSRRKATSCTGVNKNQKVYFHQLGTPQDDDVLVYERPDQPDWGFGADVTDDGRYLLIYQSEGHRARRTAIFVQGPREARRRRSQPFLDDFDADYSVVGNDGPTLLRPDRSGTRRAAGWSPSTLASAAAGGVEDADRRRPNRDVLDERARWSATASSPTWHERRARTALRVYDLDGTLEREVALPAHRHGRRLRRQARATREGFYALHVVHVSRRRSTATTSATGASSAVQQPKVDFDADATTRPSRSSTRRRTARRSRCSSPTRRA